MTESHSYALVLWTLSKAIELKKLTTDSLRNMGNHKITSIEKVICSAKISRLLDELDVAQELKIQIMNNVDHSTLSKDFRRAIMIFKLLSDYGLRGDTANEFLKGGHFKINDGGRLYQELSEIDGAETRFSSHFKQYRIDVEKGINAGRILPEVLVIKTNINGIISSHFQSESSPWRVNPNDSLLKTIKISGQTLQNLEHIPDSFKYGLAKIMAKYKGADVHNLGPYGWSKYNDAQPITDLKTLPIRHPALLSESLQDQENSESMSKSLFKVS